MPPLGVANMKIRIDNEKIVKAVRKLNGIEIVVENTSDAREALDLILRKSDLLKGQEAETLKDIHVAASREYETSAVTYKMVFVLEFLFNEEVSPDAKVALIKELQEFFNKV
jgi:hypothetical protein